MSVFGAFTQGVNFADEATQRERDMRQGVIDRQRQNAAFDEGVQRFGALAGSQTAATTAGTVAGINQREDMHPLQMRGAEIELEQAEIGRATQAIRRGAALFQQNPEAGADAIGQLMAGLGYDEDTTGQTLQMLTSGQMTPEQLTAALEEPLTSAQRLQVDQFDQRQQLSREEMASRERIASMRGGGAGGARPFGAPFRMQDENGETVLVQRYADGSMEQIGRPGDTASDRRESRIQSTADRERMQSLQNLDINAGLIEREAQTALDLMGQTPSFQNHGMVSSAQRIAMSRVPGTPEFDAHRAIQAFMDNVGIENLLRIKREGSGLGHVPQAQLVTLQSLFGRLEVGRDPRVLERDLRDAIEIYRFIMAGPEEELLRLGGARLNIDRTGRGPGGSTAPADAAPEDDDISDLLNQY